jgi:hypothetical protein
MAGATLAKPDYSSYKLVVAMVSTQPGKVVVVEKPEKLIHYIAVLQVGLPARGTFYRDHYTIIHLSDRSRSSHRQIVSFEPVR